MTGHAFRSERSITFQMSHREGDMQVSTRFMTDPGQMRAMAGRSDVRGRIVDREMFAHFVAPTVGSRSTGGK
jgi:hypothetical protein